MSKVTFYMNCGTALTFKFSGSENDIRNYLRRYKTMDVPMADGSNTIVNLKNVSYAKVNA